MNKKAPLQAKSRQEIAYSYGISERTLRRWLKEKNIELSRGLVTPKELKIIYECFGEPFLGGV